MWSLRATASLLFPLLTFVSLLFTLSFYESWYEEALPLQSLQLQRVVVIYAGPTFHEEVVSSVACMLKDLDFYTIVYVGSGMHVGGILVPFSGRRKRSSMQFYGHCVSQWVTIAPLGGLGVGTGRHPRDPDLLVFITYPMHTKGFVRDEAAFDLLRHHRASGARGSVVLVTHRVGEMLHPLLAEIEALVDRRQLVLLFLGEHTALSGMQAMADKGRAARMLPGAAVFGHNASSIPTATAAAGVGRGHEPYTLAYLLPILPLDYVTTLSPASVPLSATLLSVLDRLVTSWASASLSSDGDGDGDAAATVFGIQGNMGGKHAHRKDVDGAVTCLRAVEAGGGVDGSAPSVGLDLVGHVSPPFEAGSLRKGKVRIFSDLPSPLYYRRIAKLSFMIPALLDRDYHSVRATSSVPAALSAGTPLTASSEFLAVYPCLRTSKWHQAIAGKT